MRSPEETSDDSAAQKSDDGSNENDRATPPEPAEAPRKEVPSVRTVADARALMRRGDADSALAGLYHLRGMKPSPARSSEIAVLIGDLYFDRKWWTDALREYRFAVTLDARARKNDVLVNNSVHALAERSSYPRARRLILDYVGRTALPALRRTRKNGATPDLRRRAYELVAVLESRNYHLRRR
jgi:hypothetical protein